MLPDMNFFLAASLLLLGLLPVAHAQQSGDDKFLTIYSLIESADHVATVGQPEEALAAYTDAQVQLEKFHKLFPNWNPPVVTYRLTYLANKIAELKKQVAPVAAPPKTATSEETTKLSAAVELLTARLQSAQAQNSTLQAKLKEALAVQPTSADPAELARAQEQIRSLMKENDLLKATRNQPSKIAGRPAPPTAAPDTAVLTAELTGARAKIADLKAAAVANALEKTALEQRLTALAKAPKPEVAGYETRLHQLTEERNDLQKKLAAAGQKNSRSHKDDVAAQVAVLNDAVKTLQARLAVAEAKPAPYSAEELALCRQPAPKDLEPIKKSVHELPTGTAEWVAAAQRHFAQRKFDLAEADYLKILERTPNNGLALANLATIELQEGKLGEAEKHITAAVAQSPDDAYNLTTLGYLKFRQEKYDEALNPLSRAAQIDPNNPEIQNYLGVTLSHKGQHQAAEAALRKAIQSNPNYAPAHNNLAVIYLSQEPPLPQLARWHYQKALDGGQPRNSDLEKLLADKGAAMQ